MSSKKILMVVGGGDFFGRKFHIGGAGEHVISLVDNIDKSRFQILLAFLTDGPTAEEVKKRDCDVYVIEKRFKLDPLVICRLYRLMKQKKVDLVNTHISNGNFYGRIAAKLAGVPVIITTIHSFIFGVVANARRRDILERIVYLQEILFSRINERIIAISKALKDDLVKNGIPREKIEVIHHGIDLNKFSPVSTGRRIHIRQKLGISPNELIVGTVGRFVLAKNYDLFLKVAAKVGEIIPNTKFIIVGDGPLKSRLEEQSKKLGIDNKIIFTNWVEDILSMLSIFDLFMLTSRTEGLGRVVIEAMACKIPVVATKVGGVPEIVVDKVSGLLIPSGNCNMMVEAVVTILKDKEMARKMGNEGRKLVESKFDATKIANRTFCLYDELLKDKIISGTS